MADDTFYSSFTWDKVGTELSIDYSYSDILFYTIETLTKDILLISYLYDKNFDDDSEYYEEVVLSYNRVR